MQFLCILEARQISATRNAGNDKIFRDVEAVRWMIGPVTAFLPAIAILRTVCITPFFGETLTDIAVTRHADTPIDDGALS